ncbi:MAG: glycosyltransferase [Anaerolineae bacterium]|nr:glycosyltransferase [Anaerolineae bacterium]
MHRVLIIAYHFPPAGGAGVQRTLKFVKYLPQFGWEPVVLTAKGKPPSLRDPSMESEIPSDVVIRRTPALTFPAWFPWRLRHFITRWLLVVDEQIGWLPFAISQGKQLISQLGIQAIYTTSAPFTDHLIGSYLKRYTGLSWIADFRDPWVDNVTLAFPTGCHRRLANRIESRIFGYADRIIANTLPAQKFYRCKYPFLDDSHLLSIPNGYDRADFEQAIPLPFDPQRFTIVHVGSLYGQTRTARPFLQAVQRLLEAGTLPRNRIRVLLVGNVGKETHELAATHRLNDVVQFDGYVPHHQSIASLLSANLLLLIPTSGPGSELFMPAKIFEYLAACRPVLALATPGAAADLIEEAQIGVVVAPGDVDKIAHYLVVLYQQWQRGELEITPNRKVIERYERRQLTGILASVLDGVIREQRD